MEILTLYFKSLRNEEHYKFHLDVNALITQYTPAVLGIELKLPAYQAAFDTESMALNVVRGSTITDDLVNADTLRDGTFSGLAGTIRATTNHFNVEVKAAAARLNLLFETYGNVQAKPYDQETAAIIKLISELESNNYAANVMTLGITNWVAELKQQNLAFDALKDARYNEDGAKPQDNLKQARIATDKAYNAIVKRIDALIEVNGQTAYAGFVTELNQRIENYNHVLAQRKGRNASDKDKEKPLGEA